MNNRGEYKNPYLLVGSLFSFAFAVFQLSAIFWSQDMLKYFGGPATMQAESPLAYALLCVAVSVPVAIGGLYALSGAGKFRPMPFTRTVLITVTVIYILRGLSLIRDFKIISEHPEEQLGRFAIYSAIALFIGLVHLLGVTKYIMHLRAVPSGAVEQAHAG
ncbi:MAG: hypothetical protein HY961_06305 [Ignavibacteriae bacterium]|nr:hypothetical protein [Ignavibacteriota bacterium]